MLTYPTSSELLAQYPLFWSKVDFPSDSDSCWLWRGGCNPKGYGLYTFIPKGKTRGVHRIAYELLVGPIPEGLEIDHLCRTRNCVYPKHLEPVTHKENTNRGDSFSAINVRKTHCKHGHEFTEANTYRKPGGTWRECRMCIVLREQRRPKRPTRVEAVTEAICKAVKLHPEEKSK